VSDESFLSQVKRLWSGADPVQLSHHERFSKVTGLAVLSSDALSSVAYATGKFCGSADRRRCRARS